MMEIREKEEMIAVKVSNIAVSRKTADDLFVIGSLPFTDIIALIYCINRQWIAGYLN